MPRMVSPFSYMIDPTDEVHTSIPENATAATYFIFSGDSVEG